MNKKDIENIYALSPQQQGMLLESLYAAEVGMRGAHIEQLTCALRGQLDIQVLEQAWQQVVNRHPVLRTAFVWKEQEEPLQVVFRRVIVPFEHQDWRGLAPADQQTRLQTRLAADRQRGFELTVAPLMRVTVFQTGDDTQQLVWTFHHILLDGWSQSLVLNDIFSTYLTRGKNGHVSQAPSHPYQDYIAWLKKQDLSNAQRYWQETLRGFIQPTPLGKEAALTGTADQAEPYGYHSARLSAATTKTLQTLARQQHLTLNTLIQGVWALLLNRYSGQTDVVFGTTVSGRPADLKDAEAMVGLFINSLPLRVPVLPQAQLWPWLQELQTQQLKLQQHGYCSVGQIRQWSEMPGTLPLYESLLVFENYPADFSTFQSQGVTLAIGEVQAIGAQTNHALTLIVTAGSDIGFQLVYRRQRLNSDSVTKIIAHLTTLLESIASDSKQSLATLLGRIPADQIPKVVPLGKSGSAASASAFVAPRTPTEESLARIWAEVLGVERIGIYQNFFELGGYSLLAIRVISRMRETFQLELPLRFLFDAPTIAEQAVALAQRQADHVDSETLEQLLTELEQSLPE